MRSRKARESVPREHGVGKLVHHTEVHILSGDSYRTRARRGPLAKDRDK